MPTAPDFLAACVDALEANAACVAAFSSTSQSPKFFGIYATRTQASPNVLPPGTTTAVQPPYARLLEVGASDTFQSGPTSPNIFYFERGILQVDVFDTSATGARTKAKLIANVLNDANLEFADGGNLECRQTRRFFIPEPDSGPGGTAIVYHFVTEYLYMNQYAL